MAGIILLFSATEDISSSLFDKNTIFTGSLKSVAPKLNSCLRKLVVEIVSTNFVGTLKCFFSKCSQNSCRKNIQTSLVVEGVPQVYSD